MAGVRVCGSIAVNYRGGYIVLDVTRADALAELALDALVLDLGTEGARQVLAKAFKRYRRGYAGVSREPDGNRWAE